MVRPRLAPLAALVAALAAPGAAASERAVVQVLAVMTADHVAQAQALTLALKRAMDRSAVARNGPGDFSMEVLVLTLGCAEPPDAACERKVGDSITRDRYVWGTVRVEGAEAVATVKLWERDGPGRSTTVRYPAALEGTDDALLAVATGVLTTLLGGAPAPVAPAASARPAPPAGSAPTAAPSAPSAAPPAPPAAPPAPPPAAFPAPEEPAPGAEEPLPRWWGWVGVGAGGLLVGAGVSTWFRLGAIDDDPAFNGYRDALPLGADACAEARRGTRPAGSSADPGRVAALCDEAGTLELTQFILLGVGAVAAGAGVWWLTQAEEAPAAGQVAVAPVLVPGQQGVRLRVGF